MTYVVTEPCIKCKYTDCVEVCPVDCFHEGSNFLVIDPVGCIDCSLCADECPANAIYAADSIPSEYAHYLDLNARLAASWPVLNTRKEPLPDADAWLEIKDKFSYLRQSNDDDAASLRAVPVQMLEQRPLPAQQDPAP